MAKITLFLIIVLIFIIGLIAIFSDLNLANQTTIPVYPQKFNFLDKLLADISNIFQFSQKRVEVNLSEQKVKLFENNKIVNEFIVSTGEENTPTPIGRFKVYNKSVMVYSKLAKCWLPFWVGFTSDGLYGFHEVPICYEGRKGLKELGKPASIGCVRLNLEDSEIFYKWVEIGIPVMIYGKEPTEIVWCHDFKDNLKFGDTGEEVKALQEVLIKEKVYYGSVDGYFGKETLEAVKIFQEKYVMEILYPWSLIKGSGFVGSTTRNQLNQLYGCW